MWQGREKLQKFEYLGNEKSFFIVFKGLSFGEKIKNSRQKVLAFDRHNSFLELS